MSKKFLIRQIKDRNNKFFSCIRTLRETELKTSRESYTWASYSYKLYPSSFRSFTMCPKKFVEEDVHKPPNFSIEQSYKMEIGTALHKMYQSEILAHTSILWPKPNVTTDLLKQKLENNWPEVPVFDAASGISGRADAVLDLEGEIAVFDIKTTSVPRDKWEQYKRDRLPGSSHLVQIATYIYLMNKYNYYSKKVTKGGLGYVNISMLPGEEGSEYEYYFDYTEEMEQNIGLLIEALSAHRKAFLEDQKIECFYPNCGVHRDKQN